MASQISPVPRSNMASIRQYPASALRGDGASFRNFHVGIDSVSSFEVSSRTGLVDTEFLDCNGLWLGMNEGGLIGCSVWVTCHPIRARSEPHINHQFSNLHNLLPSTSIMAGKHFTPFCAIRQVPAYCKRQSLLFIVYPSES